MTSNAQPLQIRADSKLTQAYFQAGLQPPKSQTGAAIQIQLLTYPFLVELMNDFLFSYFKQNQHKDSLAKYIIFRFLLKCVERNKASFEAWRFIASVSKFQDTQVEVKIFMKFANYEYDHFVADFYQKVRRMVIQLINGDANIQYKNQIKDISDLFLTTDQIVQISNRCFHNIVRNFSNCLSRIVSRLDIALSGDNDTLPALDFIHQSLLQFQRQCILKQQEQSKKLQKMYQTKKTKLFYKDPHMLFGEVDLKHHQQRVAQIHQQNVIKNATPQLKPKIDSYGQPIINPEDFHPPKRKIGANRLMTRDELKRSLKSQEEKKKVGGNSTVRNARDLLLSTSAKKKRQEQPPNELSAIIPNDTLMSLGQGPGLLSSSFQPPSAIFGAIASKIGAHDMGGRLQDSLSLQRGVANGLIATPFGETDFKVRELQELCMDQKSAMDHLQRQNFKLKKQIENNHEKSYSNTPGPGNQRSTTPYKTPQDLESTNNKKAFSTIGKTEEYNQETMMFQAQSLGVNNSRQQIHKMMQSNDQQAKSMLTQLNAKGMASLSSKNRAPGLTIDTIPVDPQYKDTTLSDLISSAQNRKPKWMKKKGNHKHQSSIFYQQGSQNEQDDQNKIHRHVNHHSKKSTMVFHDSPIPHTSGNVTRAHQPADFPTLGGNKRASHIKTPPSITKSHKTSIADSYLKQLAEESNFQIEDEVPEFGGVPPNIPDRDDHNIVSPKHNNGNAMNLHQNNHHHHHHNNYHQVDKNDSFSSQNLQEQDEQQSRQWLLQYNPNIKIPERINQNIVVDGQFYDQAMQQGSICMYEVTNDFQADDKRCLKLKQGQVVYGFYTVEGWLFGFKKDNEHEYGFMPNNYVKIIEF